MICIGTRGSALAMAQSRQTAAALQACGYATRLERILTQGDRVTHLSLQKLEGKGFFTKEIEEALLMGHIDVAVHSLKDLPGEATPGLEVVAIPGREDARDALVIDPAAYDPAGEVWPLRRGATVGTSAVRRKAQLAYARADLQLIDVRGNVPTRIAKVGPQGLDAVVVAEAGLRRLKLDLSNYVHVPLDVAQFVPAPGQGALALQCRRDDVATKAALRRLHDADGTRTVAAERGLLTLLEAGCHVPLGAHAEVVDAHVRMRVFFGGDAARPQLRAACHFVVQGDSAEDAARRAYAALLRDPSAAACTHVPAPIAAP